MFSTMDFGRLAGFLYLFILLTSVLSQFAAGAPADPADMPGTLRSTALVGKRFQAGIALDLLSHACIIALAGALYLAFSPHNRPLALIGTLFRVVEGTIIALNEVNKLVLLFVANSFVTASGAEAAALETAGRVLIAADEWGLKIALAFLALGTLLYGLLFVSSGAVPAGLGWWAVLAGLSAAGGIWWTLANPNVSAAIQSITFLPILPFEIVFGVWLLLKGVPK